MARKRDYRAEYGRRIERGLARGLSRSQARGHPRLGEPYVSPGAALPAYDPVLEEGVKALRAGTSLGTAAGMAETSPDRLRRYAAQTGAVERVGRRWQVVDDSRRRRMPIYSRGRAHVVVLPDYESAHYAGRYMAAVGRFLDTNDVDYLRPFDGGGVRDTRRRWYPFETDPNELYRLTAGGPEPFEDIYKILA